MEKRVTEGPVTTFGDRVRVRETPATKALGLDGIVGQVYGETTPSVTFVEVIGEPRGDYAINVYFQERRGEFWFHPDDLEFVDHAAGTQVSLNGINKKWVRTESGEWEETPGGTKHKSFWERLTGRAFKERD